MESRSTSPSPLFLAPPRWPTSAHLVVVNVTSPTTLLFFSRSLDPLLLPPSSRSASVSLPHRHLCYTGIFIAFGKTGRDFASFLLFLSNLPFPPLPSRFACPISICLSFCFQRSERDRNNLITGRCYVTRKNNCTTIYCDDSFLFFFFIFVNIIGSLFQLRALKHSYASLSHFRPEVTRASFSHSLKIIEQDVFSSLFSYIFKVPEIRVLSSKDKKG